MKHQLTKAIALLALTAVLLTGSASALFGKKSEPAPQEGAPQVWDLEIRTYRDIPGQGQFLASDPEGEDMTFALAEEPRKGTVVIEGDSFTYAPDEGITGSDHFTYTATENRGPLLFPAGPARVPERVPGHGPGDRRTGGHRRHHDRRL